MGSAFSYSSSVADNSVKSSVHSVANKMVFMPPQTMDIPYPADVNPHRIISKNGNSIEIIICWPSTTVDKVLIFSHGNASCNEHMYQYLSQLSKQLNICVIGYDYQGYGNSKGAPSEQNCYDDLEAVVDLVKTNYCFTGVNPDNIFLVGQSLGTGITMHYVSENKWDNSVILISPYKSIFTVVFDEDSTFMISSGRYDMFTTQKKSDKTNCPIKIFHGKNDQVISVEHSKKLFEVIPNKKFSPTFIDNCGHNDILQKISLEDFKQVLNNK